MGNDMRYICPIPGCFKSFKNPAGLDYHGENFYHSPRAVLAKWHAPHEVDGMLATASYNVEVRSK